MEAIKDEATEVSEKYETKIKDVAALHNEEVVNIKAREKALKAELDKLVENTKKLNLDFEAERKNLSDALAEVCWVPMLY